MKKLLLIFLIGISACEKDDVVAPRTGIDKTIEFNISSDYDKSGLAPSQNIEIRLFIDRDNPDRTVEVWDSILPRKQTNVLSPFVVKYVIKNTNSTTGMIRANYSVTYYDSSNYYCMTSDSKKFPLNETYSVMDVKY